MPDAAVMKTPTEWVRYVAPMRRSLFEVGRSGTLAFGGLALACSCVLACSAGDESMLPLGAPAAVVWPKPMSLERFEHFGMQSLRLPAVELSPGGALRFTTTGG